MANHKQIAGHTFSFLSISMHSMYHRADTKATPNYATFAPVFEEACKLMNSTRGAGSSGSVDEVDCATVCNSVVQFG